MNAFLKAVRNVYKLFILCLVFIRCQNDGRHYYPVIPDSVLEQSSRLGYWFRDSIHHNKDLDEPMSFLSRNIKYHSTYYESRTENYTRLIEINYKQIYELRGILEKLKNEEAEEGQVKFDVFTLNKSELASDIIKSVSLYRKAPWVNDLNDSVFFNFLLPYRVANEMPGFSWRNKFYETFMSDSSNHGFFKHQNFSEAVNHLHKWLRNRKMGFDVKFGNKSLNLPPLKLDVLDKLTSGSCLELSCVTAGYLRAMGIPATIDFAPRYANNGIGHEWAVALSKKNSIAVDVQNGKLGDFKHPDFVLSKVFRFNFAPVSNNHFSNVGYRDYLPDFLNNPFFEDVTNVYGKTVDIKMKLDTGLGMGLKVPLNKTIFFYLANFSDGEWKVVDWGMRRSDSITYSNLLAGGVYLPLFVDQQRSVPVGFPFIINPNGKVRFFEPDTIHLRTVDLQRKSPFGILANGYSKRMIGGKFEISTRKDFKNSIQLGEIKKDPLDTINSLSFSSKKNKGRYIRYVGPLGSNGNVAELTFYGKKIFDPPNSQIIGSKGPLWNNPNWSKDKVFDKNFETYFAGIEPDSSWVGLDLGRQYKIDSVKYLARNTKNLIYKDFDYELFYWGRSGWVSLGKKKAERNYSLQYKNVPTNCILWLRCLTEGHEERIFAYDNGNQIWL